MQQDNDPPAINLQQNGWKKKNQGNQWPDLNLIKMLWQELKRIMHKKNYNYNECKGKTTQ